MLALRVISVIVPSVLLMIANSTAKRIGIDCTRCMGSTSALSTFAFWRTAPLQSAAMVRLH
jgi:hypothetical protein